MYQEQRADERLRSLFPSTEAILRTEKESFKPVKLNEDDEIKVSGNDCSMALQRSNYLMINDKISCMKHMRQTSLKAIEDQPVSFSYCREQDVNSRH